MAKGPQDSNKIHTQPFGYNADVLSPSLRAGPCVFDIPGFCNDLWEQGPLFPQ